jgi:hyperosmotically inducible protein
MKTRMRLGSIIMSMALAGAMSMFVVGCNKAPETAGMPAASTTVGTEIDDTVVTASVKSALIADADVRGFDLKVETRKGLVQLSGFVDDQKQIDRAIAVTQSVSGVKSIENNISLKGAATTVGTKVDDTTITARVKTALLADESVKSFDIAVVTRKNEVQLSGFVDNQLQMDRAVEITRSVEGVRSINNQMSIKK